MIIIAIDPGYGRCGWAILAKPEKSKIKNQRSKINLAISHKPLAISLIACDYIETDKKKSLPDRLAEIYQAIEYLIKKYHPKELAIEELFFFKNQKTALQVAQARGVIIVAARNHHLDIFEYTPLQVKQAIVGYGRGDKLQVQKMLKVHLAGQKTPVQDDTADAVAIGLTHLQSSRINSNPNHPEKFPNANIRDNFEKIRDKKSVNNSNIIYPDLSYKINGLLFKIYNELGGGYQEKYYYKPLEIEFKKHKIPFLKQVVVDLRYKNTDIGRYIIDYVIDRKIVLEIKVNPYFSKRDIKQVLAYLERAKLELGILASFSKKGVIIKRITRGFNN